MSPSRLQRALALAARQHSVITAAQCRGLGLSRDAVHRLVRRGLWEVVGPGVYRVCGTPLTWQSRAMAAALAAGPEALVSHRSAAHLWGLDGFGAPGRIEVIVRRHSRPRRRTGVMVHETNAFDTAGATTRWGVPVTSPARTLLDVAAVADDELTVQRCLDEIRRLRHAEWPEIWEALVVHTVRGRPGIRSAEAVITRRYGRNVPHLEFARLFLRLLERAGLPEPQSEVRVEVQGDAYRVDAAYPGKRVAIELDGRDHLREEVYAADRVRDNRLELAGWLVLRFTWRRFKTEPDAVVAEVRAALAARS